MHVVVLVLTLFFYGVDKPPRVAAFVVPAAECAAIAGDAVAQIPEIDRTIRFVAPACLDVELKDET